ncbi:hypothetical protein JJE66_33725 [Bradyrhizobium diazoefficiens]|uniref:hypothetical protein n=1 Tax=Bradyrhizobium diazoefficiens TaxID=1355477 RepID=UPI00190C43B2|nr:hypothetical protein [Bradyrhizobium diazoefficiens]MBK3666168.1 hypothetical protein [Bradyrhizobium diazoefficiens]
MQPTAQQPNAAAPAPHSPIDFSAIKMGGSVSQPSQQPPNQGPKYTTQQMAAAIRQKYPGAYDKKSDTELVNAFVAKYPVYKDQLATASPGSTLPETGYVPEVVNNLKDTFNQGGQKVLNDLQNEPNVAKEAGGSPVADAAAIAAGTGHVVGDIASTAGGIIGSAITPLLPESAKSKLDEITKAIVDKVNAIPGMTPEIAKSLGDVFNTGSLLGGEEAAPGARSAVQDVADGAKTAAGALSDVASTARSAASDAANAVKEKLLPTPTIDELVGRVAQGKPEDIPSFGRGLSNLDTSKISTYKDLNKSASKAIGDLSKQQDVLLGQDTTPRKIQQLATPVKVGDTAIHHNFVRDAIDQLKTYYTKTNDVANLEKIKAYDAKLHPTKGPGLTLKDVNDIARMHGSDLNAYNANGELASGLTKQAAENTRMGLKQTVRNLMPGDESKALDAKITDLYTVRDLSKTMQKKVNTFTQRLQQPNVLQKLGGLVGKGLKVTGVGDLASKLLGIDKVPGAQTLSPAELEAKLAKNLKKIDAAMKKGDSGFVQDIHDLLQSDDTAPIIPNNTNSKRTIIDPQ